jgi:hypothetical protein
MTGYERESFLFSSEIGSENENNSLKKYELIIDENTGIVLMNRHTTRMTYEGSY